MKAKSSATHVMTLWMVLAITLTPVIFFPAQALAREELAVGSIAYSASAASLIGFVVIGNPGFEKTTTYQFPSPLSTSFTTPFFTDLEVEGEGSGRHVLARNFDTTIVMTNTSSAGLDISLTFFNQAGMPINGTDVTPIMVHIDPKGTQVRLVSALLNP